MFSQLFKCFGASTPHDIHSGGEVNANHTEKLRQRTRRMMASRGLANVATRLRRKNLAAEVVTTGEEAGVKAAGRWGLEKNMIVMMVSIGLKTGRAVG